MSLWKTDEELFQLIRKELFTGVVGDILDQIGFLHQFLPPQIKPLDKKYLILGRAMPVLEMDLSCEDIVHSNHKNVERPFGIMFDALDDLKKNEVYICTGSVHDYALWGGLMSFRAMKLKAAGAVVNWF
jgi:regulator of RNase E activity RraA